MTSYRFFQDGGHRVGNLLPGWDFFVMAFVWEGGRSICIPNFEEISQFTVEIKLLPVSENGRLP